jgi:hypothetical protein
MVGASAQSEIAPLCAGGCQDALPCVNFGVGAARRADAEAWPAPRSFARQAAIEPPSMHESSRHRRPFVG